MSRLDSPSTQSMDKTHPSSNYSLMRFAPGYACIRRYECLDLLPTTGEVWCQTYVSVYNKDQHWSFGPIWLKAPITSFDSPVLATRHPRMR